MEEAMVEDMGGMLTCEFEGLGIVGEIAGFCVGNVLLLCWFDVKGAAVVVVICEEPDGAGLASSALPHL
jgi:hypothetical protein